MVEEVLFRVVGLLVGWLLLDYNFKFQLILISGRYI
jgi:hypothetical protein